MNAGEKIISITLRKRITRSFFSLASQGFCTFSTWVVNSDDTVSAGISLENKWRSWGPNKALDPIQEVSVPEASACNLLPCEVSSFQCNISSTVGAHCSCSGATFSWTHNLSPCCGAYMSRHNGNALLTNVMLYWGAWSWLSREANQFQRRVGTKRFWSTPCLWWRMPKEISTCTCFSMHASAVHTWKKATHSQRCSRLEYPGGAAAGGVPNLKPGGSVRVSAEKAPMLWSILL